MYACTMPVSRPSRFMKTGKMRGAIVSKMPTINVPLMMLPNKRMARANVREISLTSPTAPGITHRWSSLEAFTNEVANARVWAGFHYRSSARVGTAMGREVGRYVAAHFAPPEMK